MQQILLIINEIPKFDLPVKIAGNYKSNSHTVL